MTQRVVAVVALVALAATTPVARSQSLTPQATFRTATDLVTVPVIVRVSGTPVGGLKPTDFVLTDNGVRQTVETLESEAIPADITVLVETGEQMHAYMSTVNSQLQKIIAMVRPTDRLEVLGIDTYVTEILPLRLAAQQPKIDHLPVGRLASANDALVAALLRQSDETRRHLIIAITDTIDSMSGATYETVREAARHSTAQLEVAWVTMADNLGTWDSSFERERREICGISKRCEPRARYFMPQLLPRARTWDAFASLREAAELTGGEVHPPGVFTDRTAAAIFDRVYADYRRAYLLRYTRTGVAAPGWHDIKVTIPAYPSYDIAARRGYLVEPAGSTLPSAPDFGVGSIDALIAAGVKGDTAAVDRVLGAVVPSGTRFAELVDKFREQTPHWPGTTGREFVLALRLANVGMRIGGITGGDVTRELIFRYATIARQTSPLLERDWWDAVVGMVHASLSPNLAARFLNAAADRFPDEPRFVLAKAISLDQQWRIGDAATMGSPKDRAIREALDLYERAAVAPATRQEALVRVGFFLHRLGRDAEALAKLEAAADNGPDTYVNYWRAVFLGQVLEAVGRSDDATASFRRARALAPAASSAVVALMTQLARHGGGVEAKALAELALSGGGDDPWLDYWIGEARFLDERIARLEGFR